MIKRLYKIVMSKSKRAWKKQSEVKSIKYIWVRLFKDAMLSEVKSESMLDCMNEMLLGGFIIMFMRGPTCTISSLINVDVGIIITPA